MRAIRMQMLAGILLRDGPRRDDFDLYSIERDLRVNRDLSLSPPSLRITDKIGS